jgi:phosphonate transport system substrate-binding protein
MWKLLTAFALCAVMHQAGAQGLIMGVSEGTSGGLDHAQVINKYQGLADVIGRSIKQKVNVVFAREFSALEEGMKVGRFDFVIARPSDYPARGMRDYGYKFVASAKPDGQCLLIVPKDSPIKTLADMKGKKIALPELAAYMTKFCRAELRDKGFDVNGQNVQYVREQGAVAFWLDNKFADVGGVASYSGVAKKWEKDGNRVIHKSVPQPYFPLIAGKKISAAQVEAIQKSLLAMPDNETDQGVLKTVGIKEFDVTSEKRLADLLTWLGK